MKKLLKNYLINVMEKLIICFQVQALVELLVELQKNLRKKVLDALLWDVIP